LPDCVEDVVVDVIESDVVPVVDVEPVAV